MGFYFLRFHRISIVLKLVLLFLYIRKYTLADDSANIKDIKARFLPGGDLYEDGMMLRDGYFRKRKFAHVGSETSLDLFADDRVLDSGDEQFNDENSQAEAIRRKQRLEKEEFLSEMRVRLKS